MTDTPTVSYFTVTIAEMDGKPVICFVSTANNQTHNQMTDADGARSIVKSLNFLIDVLDPPPKQWQVTAADDAKLVAKLSDDIKDTASGLAEKAAAIMRAGLKRRRTKTSQRSRPKKRRWPI